MTDFAVEKLDTAFGDLQSMLPAQWQHTGDSEVDLAPNWVLYKQLEDRNGAFLVIAREDTRPIGYMVAFVFPHPNAVSVLTAEIRTYFVERIIVCENSDVPKSLIEARLGRIFDTKVSHARV